MRNQESEKEKYINNTFAHESSQLLQIRESLQRDGKEGIHIGPYEGKLLGLWLKAIRAEKVIEIGSLYGYSTLWLAQFLPPHGKIISIEKNPDHHSKAKEHLQQSPHWSQIELHCGSASSILPSLNEVYDMIFIDANKSGYMDYLAWADEHIRPGGLIIGDNTLLFNHVIGQGKGNASPQQLQTMLEFNKCLSDTKKYDSVMIPTPEGMTIALKK